MVRLLILVEGETEESFVNELLMHHLGDRGIYADAKLMGNARNRSRRGGIRAWPGIRDEITRHLERDSNLYVSVMADYYALPGGEGDNAWPGRSYASTLELWDRASHIEEQLRQNIGNCFSNIEAKQRFIPYIMMHEFEGLLFSNCQKFASSIGRLDLYPALQAIRDAHASPEAINDSPQTHPSKRIQGLMPEYQKPLYGTLAALEIGLDCFRQECPGFRRWLEHIEALSNRKMI